MNKELCYKNRLKGKTFKSLCEKYGEKYIAEKRDFKPVESAEMTNTIKEYNIRTRSLSLTMNWFTDMIKNGNYYRDPKSYQIFDDVEDICTKTLQMLDDKYGRKENK